MAMPRCEGYDSAMNSTDELRAVRVARAFCDHTRFLIYKHIAEVNEMRCQDICLGTAVCASTVSHHLKVLSDSCLIESRREGQAVYYRTVPNGLRAYLKVLRTLERKERALRKASTVAAKARADSQ
jgi:DNA-binding transcriptional ArsR family regulator